jgi:capsular polysaccharide transport system permease protein
LLVAIPTLAIAFYNAFWASDIYISESRFVVRSAESRISSGLGSLLQEAALGKTQDDSSAVREFILSRDALQALQERMDLKSRFGSKDVDVFSRFSSLDGDDSFEALHRYYQKKVDVQTDSTSSVVTLTFRAFRAADAQQANRILLEQSEELVNRLNERSRRDLIRYAENEVREAERAAKATGLALSVFRNNESVVDPEKQAALQLQQVAKLQDDLIATRTQLAQLQVSAPSNPQIPVLKGRVRAIASEMESESSRVTGGKSSLANKAAGMQQLALEAEFASKQLASALAGLESARSQAQRQQVYVERVAQPSLPDMAQEPRRFRAVLSTLAIGFVVWFILGLLLTGIREHEL